VTASKTVLRDLHALRHDPPGYAKQGARRTTFQAALEPLRAPAPTAGPGLTCLDRPGSAPWRHPVCQRVGTDHNGNDFDGCRSRECHRVLHHRGAASINSDPVQPGSVDQITRRSGQTCQSAG
jgi:hypothetical protein